MVFCPTSEPRRTGRSSGFSVSWLSGPTLEYPAGNQSCPVMQAFAAHALSCASERKYSRGKCREFPPFLARGPVRVPPPAGRPASDPLKTEYRLAGRPAGGLDDEHDSTPRNKAHGAKKSKSGMVSSRLRGVCSALTHVKARMRTGLSKG